MSYELAKEAAEKAYTEQHPAIDTQFSITESVFGNDLVRFAQVILSRAYVESADSENLQILARYYGILIETGSWDGYDNV